MRKLLFYCIVIGIISVAVLIVFSVISSLASTLAMAISGLVFIVCLLVGMFAYIRMKRKDDKNTK